MFGIIKNPFLKKKNDERKFIPITQSKMAEKLRKEFPEFDLLTTTNYIILYQTSRAYADWNAKLLENLYHSFYNFWKKRGANLYKPEFPLVAIIYSDKKTFRLHAADYFSDQDHFQMVAAFYSPKTNYIFVPDLTNTVSTKQTISRRATREQIGEFLKQPRIKYNISTIIHEGVHQISYNVGIIPRYTSIPSWFSEGLATIHEVPTQETKLGWESKIKLNDWRIKELHKYLSQFPLNPILTLVREDQPFKIKETQSSSYGMAGGMMFYLMHRHPEKLLEYFEILNKRTLFSSYPIEKRQADFEKIFGKDWNILEKDFQYFILKLIKQKAD
jgi:hypothetical protein